MKKGGMKTKMKAPRMPPMAMGGAGMPPMAMGGMKHGGSVKKFAGGGVTRGDGIAQRGHTRGKNR